MIRGDKSQERLITDAIRYFRGVVVVEVDCFYAVDFKATEDLVVAQREAMILAILCYAGFGNDIANLRQTSGVVYGRLDVKRHDKRATVARAVADTHGKGRDVTQFELSLL